MSNPIDLEAALRLVDEAERVAGAATEPPWHANDIAGTYLLQTGAGYESMALDGRGDTDDENEPANVSSEQGRLNMEFCVYARTSVPALASTVRGLVERVRELERPAWQRSPTCAGWWVMWRQSMYTRPFVVVHVRESELSANADSVDGCYCYGPIQAPPSEESTNG